MRYSISTYTLFSLPIDEAIETLISKRLEFDRNNGRRKESRRVLLDMDRAQLKKIAKLGESQ